MVHKLSCYLATYCLSDRKIALYSKIRSAYGYWQAKSRFIRLLSKTSITELYQLTSTHGSAFFSRSLNRSVASLIKWEYTALWLYCVLGPCLQVVPQKILGLAAKGRDCVLFSLSSWWNCPLLFYAHLRDGGIFFNGGKKSPLALLGWNALKTKKQTKHEGDVEVLRSLFFCLSWHEMLSQ